MSRRRGLPRPPLPMTHSVLFINPRCPRCMLYFWLSHFVRGYPNVTIFLLRILVAFFSSEANPTTKMSRRRGLPRPPSPTTHSVLFMVPRRPRCMLYFWLSYFVRGEANALHIFVCIFVCVIFLATAQPILVYFYCNPTSTMRRRRQASPMFLFRYLVDEGEFCLRCIFVRGTAYISIFLLQPINYDEEEVAIIAYSSILLSCQ
jgi:hypothetical protein